ncbi:MAG TPA: hypothetical protein VIE63_11670 [Ramlibacter sp.]|jgi:hypothetical protein
MATAPSRPDDAPRSDEGARDPQTSTPDEAGPNDVPDEQVIEHTLPSGSRSSDPARPR